MSNPFSADEYGRLPNSRHPLPPDSTKSSMTSAHMYVRSQMETKRSKRFDGLFLGLGSLLIVAFAFFGLIILIQNISPDSPTRLTPDGTELAPESQEEGSEIAGDERDIQGN